MTVQIADALDDVLQPKGVAVVIEAPHQCMSTRGVHKVGAAMVTSRMLGAFRTDSSTRRAFLAMIGRTGAGPLSNTSAVCRSARSNALLLRLQRCDFIKQIQRQRHAGQIDFQITGEPQGQPCAMQGRTGETPVLWCFTERLEYPLHDPGDHVLPGSATRLTQVFQCQRDILFDDQALEGLNFCCAHGGSAFHCRARVEIKGFGHCAVGRLLFFADGRWQDDCQHSV